MGDNLVAVDAYGREPDPERPARRVASAGDSRAPRQPLAAYHPAPCDRLPGPPRAVPDIASLLTGPVAP